MDKNKEKSECKKEYTVPQMEVLAFEAPVSPLCCSGGDGCGDVIDDT